MEYVKVGLITLLTLCLEIALSGEMISTTSPAALPTTDPGCSLVSRELLELLTLIEIMLNVIAERAILLRFLDFGGIL